MRRVYALLALAALSLAAALAAPAAEAQIVEVNVTNETVELRFTNMTIINFTRTMVNVGWYNLTYIACSYTCIYVSDPAAECDTIRVEFYNDTVPAGSYVFNASDPGTVYCPGDLQGICYATILYNATSMDVVRILVVNLDTNETEGPIVLQKPYEGPELKGYAGYIGLLLPYAVLVGLAGRLSLKMIGVGLFIYGLIVPAMTVLGIRVQNLPAIMALSIITGVVFMFIGSRS